MVAMPLHTQWGLLGMGNEENEMRIAIRGLQ